MASTLANPTPQSFVGVPLSTMAVSSSLSVDLYIKPSPEAEPVLYRQRKLEFPPEEFERLRARGIETVYVAADQMSDYQQHLHQNLGAVIHDHSIPLERRVHFLSETGRSMLGTVFKSGSTDKVVGAAEAIGRNMVQVVTDDNLLVGDLFDVLRHDYHTFTHSYNVANYCVMLAQGLGINETEQLEEISRGGLLHDLGKLQIPLAILNKKSRLSDAEWTAIRRHPVDGFYELCGRNDLTSGQLMMVYQHHEKLDGSGYPVGCGGDEIHMYARMCAVVDIFEALTSHRPYRRPMPVKQALGLLEEEAGKKLDQEMVKCWKALMTK